MQSLFSGLVAEKPHSSITDWVEILSSEKYKENDYDGIPEIVDAINLQPEGPTEASRAIRKKLKYGNTHRQLRALTILKALVENCGTKFQLTFADGPLITRIKTMASDPLTDEVVRKKLMSVLAGWHREFKDNPKMATVASLWTQCGGGVKRRSAPPPPQVDHDAEARKRAEEKAKEKAAREEEKRRERERKEKEKADAKKKSTQPKPRPFDFEKEKPNIINSIATASQAAIQLTNALKLVNREKESIESNTTVQEALTNAKAARKAVIRYIQRVENEELIGTLLDVNERIITSLQHYDQLLKSAEHDSDEDDATAKMAELSLKPPETEISKLQGKQRAAIERANSRSSLNVNSGGVSRPPGTRTVHPDLRDVSWGTSQENTGLPPPLQPRGADEADSYRQGSLSDYSDYSSDEDRPRTSTSTAATSAGAGPSYTSRGYGNLIGDEDDLVSGGDARKGLLDQGDDDPFADPFADDGSRSDLGTPMLEKRQIDAEL
ncbi:putative actin patch assembly and actin polymerization protein [Tulasnella sp. 424]|nr:putative actin patch assembly and actin polymerization protein [Tulasnella sp. 424]